MTGLVVPAHPVFNYVKNFTNDPHYTPKQSTPDIWNWQQQGVVGPIRDQGSCGSCWAYSTVGNIESLNYIQSRPEMPSLVPYSPQQLIDCDTSNFGCNGGWPYMALYWLTNNGGLMTEEDYPILANKSHGSCKYDD